VAKVDRRIPTGEGVLPEKDPVYGNQVAPGDEPEPPVAPDEPAPHPWLAPVLEATRTALAQAKTELAKQSAERDRLSAERTARWAATRAEIARKHLPHAGKRAADSISSGQQIDHANACLYQEEVAARRTFELENPPVVDPAVGLAQMVALLVRHLHELRSLNRGLGASLAAHETATQAFHEKLSTSTEKQTARLVALKREAVKAALKAKREEAALLAEAASLGIEQ
jgi:hypothetical protein